MTHLLHNTRLSYWKTNPIRGDRDRAIAGLHDAIDQGWRVSGLGLDGAWWTLRQDWKLASLHQDPEFLAIMNELEADIAAQRQWYEENKDKPLVLKSAFRKPQWTSVLTKVALWPNTSILAASHWKIIQINKDYFFNLILITSLMTVRKLSA